MRALFLSALGLSHFRSHLHTTILLDPRPVVLFGANGAGKTNVLEAVSLLSPGRGLRRAAAADMMRRPETIGWKVTARLTAGGRGHEVETWAEPGAARTLRIDGKAAAQSELGRIARLVWLVPSMDRLWTDPAEARRRFLDRLALGFCPDHAEAALTYERAMRERNRLLREGSGDARWLGALEARMAVAGERLFCNRRFALNRLAAAADPESPFPRAELALETDGIEAESNLAAALRSGRQEDAAAGRTLRGPHRADLAAVFSGKGIAARDGSTGEQKALLLSVVLANARAIAAEFGAPPILLLDELAAHLDAGRRDALFEAVIALGSQAWLTGTGRELFAPLEGRATFLRVEDRNGASHVALD